MLDCIYLAITASELWKKPFLQKKIAYMACHFSLYGPGLSNIPGKLPPESLLIVNDRIPVLNQDPILIADQLVQAVEQLSCSGVLLDLERPGEERVKAICRECVARLPCPLGISPWYAEDLDCAVFLPPIPPDTPVDAHFAPYRGRRLWLEVENSGLHLTLTKEGCQVEECPATPLTPCFADAQLHCSYQQSVCDHAAHFTFWRTGQQLEALVQEAKELGAETFVGLYQQLKCFCKTNETV